MEEQLQNLEKEIDQAKKHTKKKNLSQQIEESLNLQTKQMTELKKKLDNALKISNLRNMWILKPGENTNRGIGITVHTNVQEIKQIINSEAYNNQRTFIL